ncbi:MAG: tetratricopeptide repeat protein [Armatimonadota bacterium]
MNPPEPEAERLLVTANLHRIRGDILLAEQTCRQALALRPKDPDILEFLGDLLAEKGDAQQAQTVYKSALEVNPGNARIEDKIARLVLSSTPTQSQQRRAAPPPSVQSHQPLGVPAGTAKPPASFHPNPGVALFLGSLFPGLGQFYTGQLLKGIVVIGLAVLTACQIAAKLIPVLTALGGAYSIPSDPEAIPSAPAIPSISATGLGIWVLAFLAIWLYGCIDATLSAFRTQAARARGWQSG